MRLLELHLHFLDLLSLLKLLLLRELVHDGQSRRGRWLSQLCVHDGHAGSRVALNSSFLHWVVRVPKLRLSMGKRAVLTKPAVPFLKEITLDGFVIAVGVRHVVALLGENLVDIALWQGARFSPQFILSVCKVATAASLTPKSPHKVLANIRLVFGVESRIL